jgi:type I restriction enzyme S subunit
VAQASDIPEGYKATELDVLPEEWNIVAINEIAEKMRSGGTPSRKNPEYWGGSIPFVLIEDMTSANLFIDKTKETINENGLQNSSAWIVPPNSLLLSMYATIGATAINTIPLATNQAILAIIPKSNFDIIFLAYSLQFHSQRLASQNVQSTQKNVNKGIVASFQIPLPPLPEQRAIAHVLRTVQEAKEKTDAVIAATKALKAAMMKHLFTYGPVPLEEVEKVVLRETEIGPVPEVWEISTLGKIAHIGNGSTPKRDNSAYWENGTIPWITSTRVHDSIISQADYFITELAVRECHLPLVKKGSLVVAITGQGKTLGNTALIAIDTRINQHLAYVEFNDDTVVSEFMLRFMQSRYQQLREVSHASGSTKGALTCGFLKTFPVPLPPKNEQKQITTILSTIDQKIAAEESRRQALDTLFTTLLHDLMTAKIRVKDMVPMTESATGK